MGGHDLVEQLARRLQDVIRSMSCERAEHSLEKAELDLKIADVQTKVQWQHEANLGLFRRVQMLEQVLHGERLQNAPLLRANGLAIPARSVRDVAAPPASPRTAMPRKPSVLARDILQACLISDGQEGVHDVRVRDLRKLAF